MEWVAATHVNCNQYQNKRPETKAYFKKFSLVGQNMKRAHFILEMQMTMEKQVVELWP